VLASTWTSAGPCWEIATPEEALRTDKDRAKIDRRRMAGVLEQTNESSAAEASVERTDA
jgi:hypothetical protein